MKKGTKKRQEIVARRIGQRIRQARTELRISQAQLADQLGIPRTTVTEYESGKYSPHASQLPHLAEILQVSILYFFQDEGISTSDAD